MSSTLEKSELILDGTLLTVYTVMNYNSKTTPLPLQVWVAGETHSQDGVRLSDMSFRAEFFLTIYCAASLVREVLVLTAILAAATCEKFGPLENMTTAPLAK